MHDHPSERLMIKCSTIIQIELEFGKLCWFLRRGENQSTRRKTSPDKEENQQQTQPTYDARSGNRTQDTLVGDYEAVFISTLTCQLSSFFVQNFVQRMTTTLYEQRQLCKDNDNFVRIILMFSHFVQTMSTLQGQRQLCTNNVHTLYEQRQLCTNNVNFARTTTTLYE